MTNPNNIWANVVYDPNRVTLAEMAKLQEQLDQVIAENPAVGSFESVERIFEILHETGLNDKFVDRHWEEFRYVREGYEEWGTPHSGDAK